MAHLFQYYSHLQKYLIFSYHFHHRVYIILTNSKWPGLQLAWLAQWIERCVRLSQKPGFDYRAQRNVVHVLPIFFFFFSTSQLVYLTARIISTFIHFTLLWLLQMVFPWSCAYDPSSSLVKFAINSRPWRLEEPILNGRERGDECYISQTCK